MPLEGQEAEVKTVDNTSTDTDAGVVDASTGKSASSAEQDETKSTLSIVRDVVTKSTGDKDKSGSSADTEDGSKQPTGEAKADSDKAATDQPKPEDYSDVPFNKHPRFRELLNERRSLKADVEQLREPAEQYGKIQQFIRQNGMTAEEAADNLLTLALIKSDPVKAWERLKPVVEKLVVEAGVALPEDLRERVCKNELTAEAAAEIAQSRAKATSLEARTAFEKRQREDAAQQEAVKVLGNSVRDWVNDRLDKDPLFKDKKPLFDRCLSHIHASEGIAKDAAKAVEQLKRAYDETNTYFVAPKKQVQGKRDVKPIGNGSGGNKPVITADSTTLDVIRAKVGQHYG